MRDKSVKILAHMETRDLNLARRTVNEAMAELKLVERNLRVLVNQNMLDKTPTLLSGDNTGELERLHASGVAIDSLNNARDRIANLLD